MNFVRLSVRHYIDVTCHCDLGTDLSLYFDNVCVVSVSGVCMVSVSVYIAKNFVNVFYSEPKKAKNSVFILSDIKKVGGCIFIQNNEFS